MENKGQGNQGDGKGQGSDKRQDRLSAKSTAAKTKEGNEHSTSREDTLMESNGRTSRIQPEEEKSRTRGTTKIKIEAKTESSDTEPSERPHPGRGNPDDPPPEPVPEDEGEDSESSGSLDEEGLIVGLESSRLSTEQDSRSSS